MPNRYVSIIGAATCDAATAALAEEVGRLVGQAGAVLVCGGLGGVMEAACRGAKEAGGTTLGILPGLERTEGNPHLDYSVVTGIGHARNLAVAASGDSVIAVGGEFGTLSEIGHAGKVRRRVVLLASWDVRREGKVPEGVLVAASPVEAVNLATT